MRRAKWRFFTEADKTQYLDFYQRDAGMVQFQGKLPALPAC